jgi:NADPH:quinone reductase-like Zn-dependent oxidoreductase
VIGTPGQEVCGEVISSPTGSGLAVGDRVLGLPLAFIGGLAEHVTMDLGQCLPAPAELEYAFENASEAMQTLAGGQSVDRGVVLGR